MWSMFWFKYIANYWYGYLLVFNDCYVWYYVLSMRLQRLLICTIFMLKAKEKSLILVVRKMLASIGV